jgi:hypothetical protein
MRCGGGKYDLRGRLVATDVSPVGPTNPCNEFRRKAKINKFILSFRKCLVFFVVAKRFFIFSLSP